MATCSRCGFLVVLSVLLINTVRCDDPIVTITQTTPLKDPVDGLMKCAKDQDAYITCAVRNLPEGKNVKWVRYALGEEDGILTPISTDLSSEDPFKYALEKPSPTAWRLRVQNVQVTDEGRYLCRVQTNSQTYVKAVADIRVTEVPKISDLATSSDMTVKEGDNIVLRCNATGRPFPLVSWSRMAGELLPNGGEELRDYTLRITNAKAQHAGKYKCSAKNFAGEDHRSIFLNVKFSPIISTDSPKVYQAVGYVKDLICYVEAYPVPSKESVVWSHSNVPIYNEGRFIIENNLGAYNRITSILRINGVRSTDYGIYKCMASNEQGNGEAFVTLSASNEPSPDRTGVIQSGSSAIMISLTTVVMLLTTCLLQRWNM